MTLALKGFFGRRIHDAARTDYDEHRGHLVVSARPSRTGTSLSAPHATARGARISGEHRFRGRP